jgi:energy-coupling factor transport system substrate-specific component
MEKITRRRLEFLKQLAELFRSKGEAVHYSALAESMQVGNVTAYEMLRLLEEQDLVASAYQRDQEQPGPGRSAVVFQPTAQALQLIRHQQEGESEIREWQRARNWILKKIHHEHADSYSALLDDLMKRIPQQPSSIGYLTEMVTALVLGINSLRDIAPLRNILVRFEMPGEQFLNTLPGIGIGLSMVSDLNQQISKLYLSQADKFQSLISDLSRHNRRQLAEFTRELLDLVNA